MKTLLLIFSLLLSLFSGGKDEADAVVFSYKESYCVSEASSSDTDADYSLNRDLCITAAQGQAYSGSRGVDSVSLRNTNTGRRTSPHSTFRVVKDGKVIDNNRTNPFLAPVFVPMSGVHISERYLFSICRLRL